MDEDGELSEAEKEALRLEAIGGQYRAVGERCMAELEALMHDAPPVEVDEKAAYAGFTFKSALPHSWVIPVDAPEARVGVRGMMSMMMSSDLAGCVSPDGSRVLTIDMTYTYVWDARSGALLLTLPIPVAPKEGQSDEDAEPNEITLSASFSTDGRHVITTPKSGNCIIYDAHTGTGL